MAVPGNPDQSAPAAVTPAGVTADQQRPGQFLAQAGKYPTTAQGLRLPDTDHSLKAGPLLMLSRRPSPSPEAPGGDDPDG